MSDLHVGEGLFRADPLKAAIAETHEHGPDLVVVAGDLTMEGYRSEFEACKRSWASSRARTLSWRSARQVERGLLRVVEDEHAGQPAVDALGRLAMQVRMAPERRGWPVDRSSPGPAAPGSAVWSSVGVGRRMPCEPWFLGFGVLVTLGTLHHYRRTGGSRNGTRRLLGATASGTVAVTAMHCALAAV